MCGIVGFLHFNKTISEEQLRKMTSRMDYRGPDDEGYYFSQVNDYQLGFGFKRLSILDLSELGHQPMHFENLSIVFNGEVYNYQEIREDLKRIGYTFHSDSDTEVILKSFHCWGRSCVERFNGMFAIAIYDANEDEVVLFRDRMGIKPLYYSLENGDLLFSSELGPLLEYPFIKKEIDQVSISSYLYHGYLPATDSMIRGVKKLAPGSLMSFKKGAVEHYRYYKLERVISSSRSFDDTVAQLDELLQESVKKRLIAHVPVGCFLSGGYDSSLASAVMQRVASSQVNTFSLGFNEKKFDESEYAKAIAKHLGTRHHELIVSVNDVKELLPQIISQLDEPLGDSSLIPTWMVSRLAKDEVKVVLSGDGGDELFAGYRNYAEAMKLRSLKWLGLPFYIAQQLFDCSKALGKLNHRFAKYPYLWKDEHIINHGYLISKNYLGKLLIKGFQENASYSQSFDPKAHLIENYTMQDLQSYLPGDILTKVDRASMMNSIEARTPYLDYNLVNFALTIPIEEKLQLEGKAHLKTLAHKYIPKELLERPKKGFSMPIHDWLKGDLSFLVNENLSQDFITKQGIFKWDEVSRLLTSYRSNQSNEYVSSIIWNMVVFQIWWKQNLSN